MQFVLVVNESHESCVGAIAWLETAGLIRTRKNEHSGRREYSISERIRVEVNLKSRYMRGRCPDCKHVGNFQTRYTAIPHSFFRKLGACIDHAAFVCLAVIVKDSLLWSAEEGLSNQWVELQRTDFEQLTGLDKDTVTKALKRLDDWGLIEREEKKGRPSSYRAVPEMFGKLERRGPREVEQPPQPPAKKKKAKVKTPEPVENPINPPETLGVESKPAAAGFCSKCRHFVTPEPVSDEEYAEATGEKPAERPPRAGPKRETTKKPTNRMDEAWEVVKRWAGQ